MGNNIIKRKVKGKIKEEEKNKRRRKSSGYDWIFYLFMPYE